MIEEFKLENLPQTGAVLPKDHRLVSDMLRGFWLLPSNNVATSTLLPVSPIPDEVMTDNDEIQRQSQAFVSKQLLSACRRGRDAGQTHLEVLKKAIVETEKMVSERQLSIDEYRGATTAHDSTMKDPVVQPSQDVKGTGTEQETVAEDESSEDDQPRRPETDY